MNKLKRRGFFKTALASLAGFGVTNLVEEKTRKVAPVTQVPVKIAGRVVESRLINIATTCCVNGFYNSNWRSNRT